jgi:hypothetical protein
MAMFSTMQHGRKKRTIVQLWWTFEYQGIKNHTPPGGNVDDDVRKSSTYPEEINVRSICIRKP